VKYLIKKVRKDNFQKHNKQQGKKTNIN
jgi:hypothetical protein